MRASVTERERSLEVLQTSFAEGRLTGEELDLRVEQALLARYFGGLMAITADLPVGPFGRLPAHPPTPAFPRASRLAVAALACGVAGPLSAGITAVPAIVLGQLARRQIRRTGERGLPSRRRRSRSAGYDSDRRGRHLARGLTSQGPS